MALVVISVSEGSTGGMGVPLESVSRSTSKLMWDLLNRPKSLSVVDAWTD